MSSPKFSSTRPIATANAAAPMTSRPRLDGSRRALGGLGEGGIGDVGAPRPNGGGGTGGIGVVGADVGDAIGVVGALPDSHVLCAVSGDVGGGGTGGIGGVGGRGGRGGRG